jgi:hypothetical protein
MKRVVWGVVLAALAVYGWVHAAAERAQPPDEIVAVNRSGHAIGRVRLAVAGRHLDLTALAPGATARTSWRGDREGAFEVTWRPEGSDSDRHWRGGRVSRGPVPMRHRLEFVRGDGLVFRSEPASTLSATAHPRRRPAARRSR